MLPTRDTPYLMHDSSSGLHLYLPPRDGGAEFLPIELALLEIYMQLQADPELIGTLAGAFSRRQAVAQQHGGVH